MVVRVPAAEQEGAQGVPAARRPGRGARRLSWRQRIRHNCAADRRTQDFEPRGMEPAAEEKKD
jgi:hypothetical protein